MMRRILSCGGTQEILMTNIWIQDKPTWDNTGSCEGHLDIQGGITECIEKRPQALVQEYILFLSEWCGHVRPKILLS